MAASPILVLQVPIVKELCLQEVSHVGWERLLMVVRAVVRAGLDNKA